MTPCGDLQALAAAPLLPACTIVVRDRSRRGPHGLGELRHIYGLTLQESKVALTVAEGHGLAEAAQSLGLSVLTVRNHLQRVFAKTGTSRQAELAQLIATLAN
jgi:DNA-binding CsgD family transcriptional regulator